MKLYLPVRLPSITRVNLRRQVLNSTSTNDPI